MDVKESKNSEEDEGVFIADLSPNYSEKEKQVVKIHKQFAHPKRQVLEQLLRDSGNLNEEVHRILDKIYTKCQVCHEFAASKPRPVVGLPLGRRPWRVVKFGNESSSE